MKVSRLGSELHNHDMTEIDAAKCNTAICGLAADEVVKSYKPSHVHHNLCSINFPANYQILETADDFNLALKNVHNAEKS